MKQKNKKLPFVASFEDASILRKFAVLFLLASIIPMSFLYYIYQQNLRHGHIDMPPINFKLALLLTVLGVFVGYVSMRSLLKKIISILQENKTALGRLLSPQTLGELNQEENEIVVLSRSFSAVTKQLEENVRSLQSAKKTLIAVMAKVSEGISNMDNIDSFLDLILESTAHALNASAGSIFLLNDQKTEIVINTVYGVNFDMKNKPCLKLNPALDELTRLKQPKVVSGIFLRHPHEDPLNPLFCDNLLCVPLLMQDHVNGFITLSKTPSSDDHFSEEDMTLVFNLACQTAVAIENAKLNRDIEKTYFETISALALAVDAKDEYSRGHLDRVSDYAIMIGKSLGLDENDLNILRDAARLHDLGKIGIPDEILRKKGPLSDEEWVIMRRHPEIGESIIKPVRSLGPLCDLVRHHHEKLDGTGYPDRLKGEEISPLVRILSVADVYDALTTDRPYRPNISKEEALHILRSMKNHLDQDIVEILAEGLPLNG